jgi:phosphoglycerate dehydrogenase-like enzyme
VSAAESAGAARAASLQALLQSADAVVLHASGSACVLGDAQLALLPRGALVVSISAPGALDDAALKRALCTGALGGAAIDAPDSDAWLEAWARDAPNLVITPRVARCSEEALALAAAAAAAAALELLQPAK